MFRKEITFDTFARGLVTIASIAGVFLLLHYLSGVLLPFFVAWLLAYLIYPVVTFFQYKCHLHFRIPCIILSLLLFVALVVGIFAIVIPPTLAEFSHLRVAIVQMFENFGQSQLGHDIDLYIKQNFDENSVRKMLQSEDFMQIMQLCSGKLWGVVSNVFTIFKSVVGVLIVLLYLFFILMDYEAISEGIVNLFPKRHRSIATMILDDVKTGMNRYFRGQFVIAMIVGVMFSIGFKIVGLPMAIGLGMFIGVLNLVPYLQMLGILPAFTLAFLQSTQTGENFWLIIFYCFIVFLIVQGTQDIILTPRIMGKMMGLKPAIILLSLSVWGALLGFVGLIIALPLTTLLISYYKYFVLKEDNRGLPQHEANVTDVSVPEANVTDVSVHEVNVVDAPMQKS